MSVEATSRFGKSLVGLAELVASCGSFQTWVGAVDAAQALNYVNVSVVAGGDVTRPCAFVSHVNWTATAQQECVNCIEYGENWALGLVFEGIETAESVNDAAIQFMNHVGAVLEEMQDHSGATPAGAALSYLAFSRMEHVAGPVQPERDEAQEWAVVVGQYGFWIAFEVRL